MTTKVMMFCYSNVIFSFFSSILTRKAKHTKVKLKGKIGDLITNFLILERKEVLKNLPEPETVPQNI